MNKSFSIICLLAAFPFLIDTLCAQPTYLLAKKIGGPMFDEAQAIAIDGSDNVVITGEFTNTVDFDPGAGVQNLSALGGTDIFVAKYDASGNYLWAFKLGGTTSTDKGIDIAVDTSDNIVVTGYFGLLADFDPGAGVQNRTTGSTFVNHIYVAKYDANGNYLWANTMGGNSGSSQGRGVRFDAAGNVLACGFYADTMDTDPGAGTNMLTNFGLFLAKYDANGNHMWAFDAPPGGGDAEAVTTDISGNVFITGRFMGTFDFDPGAGVANLTTSAVPGTSDIYIAKYTSAGNYLWAFNLGNASLNESYAIGADSKGNVIITGGVVNPIDMDPGAGSSVLTPTNTDVFVAKYDPNGNYLWAFIVGAISYDVGRGMDIDECDYIHITGYYHTGPIDLDPGTGVQNQAGIGPYDFFYAKYDDNGNYITSTGIGGTGTDYSFDVEVRNSNIWLTGRFTKTVDFDPGAGIANLTSTGGTAYNIFIAKYLHVNPALASAAISGATLICHGSSTVLTASGGSDFLWNTGTTASTLTVNPTANTSYTVTVSNGGFCSATDTITVNVMSLPVTAITGNNIICQGNSTTLTASGGGTYLWSTGETSAIVNIGPTSSALYTVTVFIGNCDSAYSMQVNVISSPTVDAGNDVTVLYGESSALSASASGGGTLTYQWSPSVGLSCNTCQNPIATPQETTTYYFTVTDTSGCISSDSVTITVDILCSDLFIPTAFSPNNDGQNDVFRIEGNCIKEIWLTIYDRWGEKVFSAKGGPASGWETLNWDGTYKRKPMDTSVFIYKLTATLVNSEVIARTGNITLIR